jgi:GAF domain-containing protein
VISSSPTDVQPVFDAIAASAVRLCGAANGAVFRFDGELIHIAAYHNISGEKLAPWRRLYPTTLKSGIVTARAILSGTTVQVEDLTKDPWYAHTPVPQAGYRTVLSVPMMREGQPIGAVNVARMEMQPFLPNQVALLQTFADQAVIAIENVRLFKELEARNRDLGQALDTQTATSDILGVISRSPTDVQPVFDAIVASALRLLRAHTGALTRVEGDQSVLVALTSTDAAGDALARAAFPQSLQSPDPHPWVARERTPLNILDAHTDPRLTEATRAYTRARDFRSWVVVPLLRQGEAVGALGVTRREPGGFTDDEVALLRTFADQAVIAIENVRLFRELQSSNGELRVALEQQTATSEILRVISSSPTDLQPVFDAIVTSAMRLLGGFSATLRQIAGDQLDLVAFSTTSEPGDEALKSLSQLPLADDPLFAQAVRGRTPCFASDTETDARVGSRRRDVARARGYRSMLIVPLLREDSVIGAITVTRREPGPFTNDHIALLQTFADQAVIAIENVRLFKELAAKNRDLTQALDQQTATGEILGVIAHSPTDTQPVLDTVVVSAARLCEANDVAIYRRDGDWLRFVAHHGSIPPPGPVGEYFRPLERGSLTGRSVLEGRIFQVADLQAEADEFPTGSDLARRLGFRTILSVPLMREGVAIGTIMIRRTEAQLFTEQQVALLQTFADQAVIAIENVRLFTELQEKNGALTEAHAQVTEALEQQTATSEILRIISTSPTDLQPVLETVAASAARLCAADDGHIWQRDGAELHLLASWGGQPVGRQRLTIGRQSVVGRAAHDGRPIHVDDLAEALAAEFPDSWRMKDLGYRTILAVPLLREGAAIGVIMIRRTRVEPFTAAQVELVRTFADQAVIAIE